MYKLLIVDDERIIREGLAGALPWGELGISEVATASDGLQAYKELQSGRFDIIVTDIVMPELDGIALIERCRKEGHPGRFVVLSSHDDFKFAQRALHSGACDYILKPCDPGELRSLLQGLVAGLDEERRLLAANRKAATLLPHARTQLLHELVAGGPQQDGTEYRELLGMPGECRLLTAVPEEMVDPVSMRRALAVIEESWPEVVISFEQGQPLLLTGEVEARAAARLAGCMRDAAQEHSFAAVVLISRPFRFGDIYTANQRLMELSRLLYYFPGKDILWAEQETIQENSDTGALERFTKEIAGRLAEQDAAGAVDTLKAIFAYFATERCGFTAVRQACVQLYLLIVNEGRADHSYHAERVAAIHQAQNVQAMREILEQELGSFAIARQEEHFASYSEAIRTCIDYMNRSLADSDLSLNHIAAEVLYMSPDYLSKRFKQECGVKFSSYLLALRMNKAKALLLKSKEPIRAVAQQVGMGDNPTYFSQLFKKYTGMLPKEFRSSGE